VRLKAELIWRKKGETTKGIIICVKSDDIEAGEDLVNAIREFMASREGWEEV